MENINPSAYLLKHDILLLLLGTDLVFNCIIDSLTLQSTVLICSILQLVCRFITLFVLLLLLNQTFLFRYGLMGIICRRFGMLWCILPVSDVFCLALRITRILKFVNSSATTNVTQLLWSQDAYFGLYIVHNIASVFYYIAVLHAGYQLGNVKLYIPQSWINK